jgi:hypothetical protein
VCSWICIRGTWRYIPSPPKTTTASGAGRWRDIAGTFRYRNFRYVVILETVLGGMGGVVSTLLMVTYTYFWELDTVEISALPGGPPLLAVLIVTSSSGSVNRRFEKQQLLRLSMAGQLKTPQALRTRPRYSDGPKL